MHCRRVVMSCLAAAACGGTSRSAPSTESAEASKEGVYEYSASIPGEQMGRTLRIRGTLVVLHDSMIVHPDSNCFVSEVRKVLNTGGVTLSCGRGITTVTFDQRNPTGATWVGWVQVPKQRNACVEYRINEARRQVCVRYRPETYYARESRSGPVQVKLVQ